MKRLLNIDGDQYVLRKNGIRKKLIKLLILFQIFVEILLEKKSSSTRCDYLQKSVLNNFFGDLSRVSPGRIAIVNYLACKAAEGSIPKRLNMIDFGCGTGIYSDFFNKVEDSPLYLESFNYCGIDIQEYEDWEGFENSDVHFINKKAPFAFEGKPEEINFVFSHSSIEHVDNDEEVLEWLSNIFPNAIQMHILPASTSGLYYLAHGYRRYYYSDIVRITEKLGRNFRIDSIGGSKCLEAYYSYYEHITGASHRFSFSSITPKYLSDQMLSDICQTKRGEYPVFYALWIF